MKIFQPLSRGGAGKLFRLLCLCACALMAFSPLDLQASSTTTWEMNTYQDFIHGRFQGVSLNIDKNMMLALKMVSIFLSEHAI